MGSGFRGGMMNDMTTGDMITCYNRHLRGTPEYDCPTNNIRWQATDIRFAGTYLKDLYLTKDTKFVKSEKYIKNSYIEFQLTAILDYIKNILSNPYNLDNAIILKDIIDKSEFRDLETLQYVLLSLFEDDKFDFNKFSNILFQAFNKDNSVIYKQVLKQTYGNFSDIKEWEDFYARSLKFSEFKIQGKETLLKSVINNLRNYLSGQMQIDYESLSLFSTFEYFLTTPLLDIYFIARMFKQPTDGKRSDLTFAFFGNFHIINIKDLLLSTGAYELVFSEDVSHTVDEIHKVNRCIKFGNTKTFFDVIIEGINLNIDEELSKHSKS